MLFHTLNFAVFLILAFFAFWIIIPQKAKWQNALLTILSYSFYSFWDYRFTLLLAFSTLLDFFLGLKISQANTLKQRKFYLFLSIFLNIGVLFFFKYFNFFIDSILGLIGESNLYYQYSLKIIIPVGISFYTFHGISYIVDVYYDKIKPTRDFFAYSLFVSFFPLLIAGPIERAHHLLPQLKKKRIFNQVDGFNGLKQILWGLFKKMVIADNCQVLADFAFENYESQPSSILLLGIIFFSFQIYGDFSGYSDIAIGTGKLFGIELLKNFSYPYFSKNIIEFWKRWHISLTSWFRDYVYIPLGGNRGKLFSQTKNILIIFVLSGFWHGANWTFIFWGLLNALIYLVQNYFIKNQVGINLQIPELLKISLNFFIISFLWIFFRSPNLNDSFGYIKQIFNVSILTNPFLEANYKSAPLVILLISIFTLIEWNGRYSDYAIQNLVELKHRFTKTIFYGIVIFLIGMYANLATSPFIYFQF